MMEKNCCLKNDASLILNLRFILFKKILLLFHFNFQTNPAIGLMSIAFANGPREWGSIPGRVIPMTKEMVLDTALLNTQHYKVMIKR